MNYEGLFAWVLKIPQTLQPFYEFLLWESPLLHMNMLSILTIGGFISIIVLHIARLVLGG